MLMPSFQNIEVTTLAIEILVFSDSRQASSEPMSYTFKLETLKQCEIISSAHLPLLFAIHVAVNVGTHDQDKGIPILPIAAH